MRKHEGRIEHSDRPLHSNDRQFLSMVSHSIYVASLKAHRKYKLGLDSYIISQDKISDHRDTAYREGPVKVVSIEELRITHRT